MKAQFSFSTVLFCLVLAWISTVPVAAQIAFGPQQVIVNGETLYASSVYAADLDGDGDLDILSASYLDHKIAWYKNDGAGNFGEQQIITTTNHIIWSVYAADLDGDGDLDVVSGGIEVPLRWYKNDGAGNFGPPLGILEMAPVKFTKTLDVDGDGDLDIVVVFSDSESTGEGILWGENDGNANFTTFHTIQENNLVVLFFDVSDVDGDGIKDLVYSNGLFIAWYKSDGAGNFSGEQVIISFSYFSGILAADWDRDGDIDFCVTQDKQIIWYENNGAGNFNIKQIIENAIMPRCFFSADLDNDGDLDIVITSMSEEFGTFVRSNIISWYKNDGNGGFGTPQIITNAAFSVSSVYAADLDGDGDLDVLSSSILDGKIAWYKNEGAGNFGPQQIISMSLSYAEGIYSADLDGDGDLDLIISSLEGIIAWHENDGNGNFSSHKFIGFALNRGGRLVCVVDIDGDGDIDVICKKSQLILHENDGKGNFTERTIGWGTSNAQSMQVVDIDNDGKLDIVVVDDYWGIGWYKNSGGGEFNSSIKVIPYVLNVLGFYWFAIYAADLDSDGDMDIIFSDNNANKVVWFENDGAGNFSSTYTIAVTTNGARYVYAYDIDGDGDIDILTTFSTNQKTVWYANNGLGNFGEPKFLEYLPTNFHAVDLDNDGDIDFVGTSGNTAFWYQNDGLGNFGTKEVINASLNAGVATHAADLDGDGDLDVVVASSNDQKLQWFESKLVKTTIRSVDNLVVLNNPTTDFSLISWVASANQPVAIQLYDIVGRLIYTHNMPAFTGTNRYLLNMSEYPHGLYVVTINNGKMGVSSKVVKK